jgi:hypothetical protein
VDVRANLTRGKFEERKRRQGELIWLFIKFFIRGRKKKARKMKL